MSNWMSGLNIHMRVVVGGKDAVENDSLALGMALADLQREGWHLDRLEREPDVVQAELSRTWNVGRPPKGPPGADQVRSDGADTAAEPDGV